MDEPESMGAIALAAREKLDNLIFVVNCNLQRLDGPVRGNGKIIQELEGDFRGAGWNVIKVIWGIGWDRCWRRTQGPAAQAHGRMRGRRVPGFKAKGGAYTREHFFGKYPELKADGGHMSDDDIYEPEPRRPRSAQGLRRLPPR
jgi:pyruvate dehydrogenase E1 component